MTQIGLEQKTGVSAMLTATTGVAPRAAWTLPAAGLLLGAPWIKPWFADPAELTGKGMTFWLGPIKLGTFGSSPTDTATWARIATSDGYQLFSATQALGLLSLVFGLFVLYAYLAAGRSPRWATAALTLGVACIVPAMMMLGALAFAEARVARLYQHGIDACSASGPPPGHLCNWAWATLPTVLGDPLEGGATFLALLALVFAAMITLGAAIWRSRRLPKWVAVAFPVAYFGCLAIAPFWTLIGGFLMIVAGGRIALQLNRGAAGRIDSHDPLPAAQAARGLDGS
jgi:hypothetical protein